MQQFICVVGVGEGGVHTQYHMIYTVIHITYLLTNLVKDKLLNTHHFPIQSDKIGGMHTFPACRETMTISKGHLFS